MNRASNGIRSPRRGRQAVFGLLALLVVRPVAAQEARPAASPAAAETWARVTYLSGGTVYLDAGTRAGLAEGSRGVVVRRGATVAELAVTAVSSTRAASSVVAGGDAVVVGDSVRFTVSVAPASATSTRTPGGAPANGQGARRTAPPLRGRVGLRYLAMDQGAAVPGLARPALDLRLDGQHLGGSPLGVSLDVRASRTRLTNTPAASRTAPEPGRTLVYQAAVLLEGTGAPARLTMGRQYSTSLPAVGLFDGAAVDVSGRHLAAGAFAGNQPDAATFGLSSEIREYGAYVKVHSAPGTTGIWSLTTGAVGSYVAGEVNREVLYLQGMYVSRRLSVFTTQEIDYNRGWKTDAGEPTTSVTATYAYARLALTDALALNGGADSRRNVRLYRDYVNPEIEFDDALRQGAWGGLSLSLWSHLFASYDVRQGSGAGNMDSRSASVSVNRLTRLGLGVRGRQTDYESTLTTGRLRSGSLEFAPLPSLRMEVSAGDREDRRSAAPESGARVTWLGLGADVSLGRFVYLTFSTYRESSGLTTTVQRLGSLTYRF